MDKLRSWIHKIQDGQAQLADAGVLSVSEFITVCLAVGDSNHLPKPYTDWRSAWERLNKAQRTIVGESNGVFLQPRWQDIPVYYS